MVERIDREEGYLRAKEEINRAMEELKAGEVLKREGLYFKDIVKSFL